MSEEENRKGCWAMFNVGVSALLALILGVAFVPDLIPIKGLPEIFKTYTENNTRLMWQKPIAIKDENNQSNLLIINRVNVPKLLPDDLLSKDKKAHTAALPISLSLKMPQKYELLWDKTLEDIDEKEIPYLNYIISGKQLYISSQYFLKAINVNTGEALWSISLTSAAMPNCQNCLAIAEGKILLLSQNNMLQAFSVEKGKPLWQQKLSANPTQHKQWGIKITQNLAWVADKEGLQSFQINTGKAGKKVKIAPQNQYWLAKSPQHLLVLQNNNDKEPPKLQYWQMPKSQLVWTANLPKNWQMEKNNHFLTFYDCLFAIKIGNKNAIGAITLSKGIPRILISDENYQLIPFLEQNNTLLVQAKSLNSDFSELWAISLADGKILWKQPLQASLSLHQLAEYQKNKEMSQFWFVYASNKEVLLWQVFRDTRKIEFKIIDFQTGSVRTQESFEQEVQPIIDYTFIGDYAYLSSKNIIYAFSLLTGEITTEWP
ncbi:MAG: hypothetical protein EAZ55_05620 [Cytophagales bacterium]|nr:MAG: hypothetical protein EAZ55_05620 [Cytophagales bacterium]